MKKIAILAKRLCLLFKRQPLIEDIDEEMRLHMDLEAQSNVERGMSPKEARKAALRSFGNPAELRELGIEYRGVRD